MLTKQNAFQDCSRHAGAFGKAETNLEPAGSSARACVWRTVASRQLRLERREQLRLGRRVITLWRLLAASRETGASAPWYFQGTTEVRIIGLSDVSPESGRPPFTNTRARPRALNPRSPRRPSAAMPHLAGGACCVCRSSEACFLSDACFVLWLCSSCLLMSTRLAATLATLAPADGPSVRERGIGRKGDRKGGRERFHC